MALDFPILSSDVAAKAPIDEELMGAIKGNLEALDEALSSGGANEPVNFRLNGSLGEIAGGTLKRADSVYLSSARTFTNCRLLLDRPGDSGTLEIDVRKVANLGAPIVSILPQFEAAHLSITRLSQNLAIQSIARSSASLSVLSVTKFKPELAIQSIAALGHNLFQVNLITAPDSDWKAGDTVTIANATAAGNNGTFTIVRKNDYGSKSVVIENANGVAQSGAAGTVLLNAVSFNFSNPAGDDFEPGEMATFSGFSNALLNGLKTIYAKNVSGNNLVIKDAGLPTQAGAGGLIEVQRFLVALTSAAPSDFFPGETLTMSASNAGNTGTAFKILSVNSAGNNVKIYNPGGVIQATVGGVISSNRFRYALSSDPSAQVSLGDAVESKANFPNSGTFEVKEVNRGGSFNLVFLNPSGTDTATAAGSSTLFHTRKIIRFAESQSALQVGDRIEIEGVASEYLTASPNALGFEILQVNRGGGANYNAVISMPLGSSQPSPGGWVSVYSRSIFQTRPRLEIGGSSETRGRSWLQTETVSAVLDPLKGAIQSGERLGLYVLNVPAGRPENLSVTLT